MEKTPDHRNCLACAFPFWAQLTADEQEMLCRYTRPVHYRKGARVHSPLESCVGILLLRTGQLRAYLLSEDGRDEQDLLHRPHGVGKALCRELVGVAAHIDILLHQTAEDARADAQCLGVLLSVDVQVHIHRVHHAGRRQDAEVVSRMLKYFAQEGWVRLYRGGVQVLDKPKLQQLARGE